FEPFVTTKPQGTGLGLYICRQAVEAFGGRIGYDSSPEGSTFWFELPGAP
ncbi:MAG: ATP-binding protein, partial [Phycisphaerae bacterium]